MTGSDRATREFRVVLLAAAQSLLGDQLARVALTVLVFRASGSALITAASYAVTFLPGLTGAALGGLGDRWSRRRVLVGTDLIRAAVMAVSAVPSVPTWAVGVLIAAVVAIGGPFQAASTAVVADLFDGPRYRTAVATRQVIGQFAQLAGFAAGGAIVAGSSPRVALAVDAASFVVSALLLANLTDRRAGVRTTPDRSIRAGLALVMADAAQRRRLVMICLVGFWIVPEGLAAPYAASAGAGPVGVGVLLAALPFGFAVGSWVLTRMTTSNVPEVLAIAAGLPLLVCVARPPLVVTVVLWALCGAGTAYLSRTLAAYIAAAPSDRRAQAAGLSSALGLVAQGAGLLLGGLVAQLSTAPIAVATAGALGSVTAVVVAARRR